MNPVDMRRMPPGIAQWWAELGYETREAIRTLCDRRDVGIVQAHEMLSDAVAVLLDAGLPVDVNL